MRTKAFSVPQRQSKLGVILIFLTTLFKLLRGFWVLGVYFILNRPTGATFVYILLGLLVIAVLSLVYSYLYYRNFLFHIDYNNEEFILQKGVISTENLAIPFDKIQQVYFKRSITQRFIGVYSVIIDTAGSKSEEVSINAINKEDANLLSTILTNVKKESFSNPIVKNEGEVEVTPTEIWTHKLDILTLLKIGISTNYARGLALVIAFFATVYNELNTVFRDYAEEISSYYDRVPNPSNSFAFYGVLLVLLLLVSIIITVLEVFIKYFGLKLTQTRDSLELEMGLKTNTRVSLQPRRVQLMQVTTNPVQKQFNLYEAGLALASSENALDKKKIKIPGLNLDILEKVKEFLYGKKNSEFIKSFKPHRLMLYRRLLIVLMPLIISYLLLWWWEYMQTSLWIVFAILYAVLGIVYQVVWYRSLKLIFTEEFLEKKQGVWNTREECFEIFKLQAITVKQPFWYKRKNLINVHFHTAGGDVAFRAVSKEIFPYLNYLLYKVESSREKWM